MTDQQSEEEQDRKRAVLKAILVELAREAAWNDHLTSQAPRKSRKRVRVPAGGEKSMRPKT